jgi:AraC family transcriptional regulator, activator of mtrCDE
MDWLSQLLDIVPVSGRLEIRCLYAAPWRLALDRSLPGEIPYHIVVSGTAILEDPAGGPPHRITAGDILLLPHGRAHVLHDGSGALPVAAHPHASLNLTIDRNQGTGDRLDMLCGRFIVTPPHDRLLRDYLPEDLVVRSGGQSTTAGAQLAGLIALMRTEASGEDLGGYAMLNALSAAMFALALRVASESKSVPAGLLAAVGQQRLAPALTALFQKPGHSWTLPELARLCHMSRATFVRHFQQKIGRSASDLLTDIRMTQAATALRRSSASTSAVAEAAGYQSDAAFQRAFKQRMGMTPARWRREGRSR